MRPFLFALALLMMPPAHGWDETQTLSFDALGEVSAPNIVWDATRQRYVLSWYRPIEDGCHALMVTIVSSNGHHDEPSQVASGCDWFVNWGDTPSLAVADNGDWLTFFLRRTEGDYGYAIVMQRSADGGLTWSEPFLPHPEGTTVQHGFVAMAPAGGERVLAVWLDGRGDPGASVDHMNGPMSLRSAIIARHGAVSEERMVDARTCSCCQTALVRTNSEQHLLAYRDRSADEIRDIAWVTRDETTGWGDPQTVHEDKWRVNGCPVNGPALASRPGGSAVVWPTMVADALSVRFRPLTPQGRMHTLESGPGVGGRVDLVAFGDHWLASWVGRGQGGAASLQLAELALDGTTLQSQDMATLPASRAAGVPRMASAESHALLVWTEPVAVQGQRRKALLRGALVRNQR